jgi:hypothetical protein
VDPSSWFRPKRELAHRAMSTTTRREPLVTLLKSANAKAIRRAG